MYFEMENSKESAIPSVADYFPQTEGDLTKVAWAHAVNSKPNLDRALRDDDIMMLEADVTLGRVNGQEEVVPIMAHPPARTSDLSLQAFMETLTSLDKSKKKGIKLDFKSDDSFKKSWEVLDSLRSKVHFPVFLNADLFVGPVDSETEPLDPALFLTASANKFPDGVLSIGWATRYGPGIKGNYTQDHLSQPIRAIEEHQVKQPVTLCFRAGMAAESVGIEKLVNSIDRFQGANTTSVTIWMSSNSDPVDAFKLRRLILRLGKRRVYLDIPKFVRQKLKLDFFSPDLNSCV